MWRARSSRVVLALALAWGTAHAETLNLRQAAEAALAGNPDLAASQARIAQAEAGSRQAEGARLPRVALSVNATHTNDPLAAFGLKLGQERIGAADFQPSRLNDPASINNLNTRIEVQAPLYSGGQIGARQDEARAFLRAARDGDLATRQDILLEVLQAYQGVHLARANVRVGEQGQAAAAEYLRAAGNLHKQGLAVRSDVLSARVNLENARLRVSEARRLEATALDRLKLLMGRNPDAALEVGEEARLKLPEGGLEALRAQALTGHPGLRALRARLEAAQAATRAARGARLPQFNVLARQDWNDNRLGLDASSYTLGGSLSWNLFDGGFNDAAIDRAQAAQQELAAQLRQAEDGIVFRLTEARRRALEAEARLAAREEALREAEEAQRLTKLRYENGVTTLVDLLSAQALLDRARADLAGARHDLVVSRGQVLHAAGLLDLDQL